MQHISACSVVDAVRSQVLVHGVRSHNVLISRMFSSVRSPEARKKAMRAVLEEQLDPATVKLVLSVWSQMVEPIEDLRNSLAHHLWCKAESKPEHVVLIDPSAYVDLQATALDYVRGLDWSNKELATKQAHEHCYNLTIAAKFAEVLDAEELTHLTTEATCAPAAALQTLQLAQGTRARDQLRSQLSFLLQQWPMPLHRRRKERRGKLHEQWLIAKRQQKRE